MFCFSSRPLRLARLTSTAQDYLPKSKQKGLTFPSTRECFQEVLHTQEEQGEGRPAVFYFPFKGRLVRGLFIRSPPPQICSAGNRNHLARWLSVASGWHWAGHSQALGSSVIWGESAFASLSAPKKLSPGRAGGKGVCWASLHLSRASGWIPELNSSMSDRIRGEKAQPKHQQSL